MSNERGFDLKDYYIQALDKDIDKISNILKFSEKELTEYHGLLNIFKETNGSNASTNEKGKSLENVVTFLIQKSVVFETYRNVHTSSNEIDLLVRLNKKGSILKAQGIVNFQDNFLAECKNYNGTIGSTWVGKFYSLLTYTQNEIGILFSYKGLSGNGWNDGTGLAKKLLLSDKKSYIIDFNIVDFELLAEGNISFIDLINDKMFSLKNDISFGHLIEEHPNQNLF